QSAESEPVVVNASPNVALLNRGDTNQNSGTFVNAPASNTATQTNNQRNALGQNQTSGDHWSRCCSKPESGNEQEANQSNTGANRLYQQAESEPVVFNVSPNIAFANGREVKSPCETCGGGGDVHQNSFTFVNAPASNTATQKNNQSNALGQTQTVGSGSDWGGCCSKSESGNEQEANQSNTGTNSARQAAESEPFVINGSPNVAIGNSGETSQESGTFVNARASNSATQTNNQSNEAGQTQTGRSGACESECHPSGCTNDCKREKCKPHYRNECKSEHC